MLPVFEQLVLKGSFEITKASLREAARLVNVRPSIADGNAEILGNALRQLDRNIPFGRRRHIPGLRPHDCRKRNLVGDARIVGGESRGQKPWPDKAMRLRFDGRHRQEEQCKRECTHDVPATRFTEQSISKESPAPAENREIDRQPMPLPLSAVCPERYLFSTKSGGAGVLPDGFSRLFGHADRAAAAYEASRKLLLDSLGLTLRTPSYFSLRGRPKIRSCCSAARSYCLAIPS